MARGTVFDNGGYIGRKATFGEAISTAVVTNGLILHLDAGNTSSYPGSGTTWTDLSGSGNNGTLVGGVGYSTTNGGTLTFDGTDDHVTLPSGFGTWTSGITVFAIVNFGVASNWERIIDFGNGSANNNILFARNGTSDNLEFQVFNGASVSQALSVASGITNNVTAQYAATLDGTNGRLYRNGSQIYTVATTVVPPTVTRTINYIGRSNWADAYFQTSMNVVMVYNRGLTAAEITQNYNVFKSRYGI